MCENSLTLVSEALCAGRDAAMARPRQAMGRDSGLRDLLVTPGTSRLEDNSSREPKIGNIGVQG